MTIINATTTKPMPVAPMLQSEPGAKAGEEPELTAAEIDEAAAIMANITAELTAKPLDAVVPRQREIPEKVLHPGIDAVPVPEQLVQAAKEQPVVVSAGEWHFAARFPSLVLYVNVGQVEFDKHGTRQPRNYPVTFRNGLFTTSSEAVAKALRKHPRFNGMFQEVKSAAVASLVSATAQARTKLQQQVTHGPAGSQVQGEAAFMQQSAQLDRVQQKLFTL